MGLVQARLINTKQARKDLPSRNSGREAYVVNLAPNGTFKPEAVDDPASPLDVDAALSETSCVGAGLRIATSGVPQASRTNSSDQGLRASPTEGALGGFPYVAAVGAQLIVWTPTGRTRRTKQSSAKAAPVVTEETETRGGPYNFFKKEKLVVAERTQSGEDGETEQRSCGEADESMRPSSGVAVRPSRPSRPQRRRHLLMKKMPRTSLSGYGTS
ncbi:hypothetical protein CYMTET_12644 [Cymbomonas tetramitiformis]|nr:hypothetical protein CYMTET_12644 [Cymbomonas tetramitiformis]